MDDMTLSKEQEQQILDLWNSRPANPPSIKELQIEVFGQEVEARSPENRALKEALSKFNLRSGKEKIELSEAHKLFITNNAKTMNSLELAKEIFRNNSLTNLHAETRAVSQYLKTLDTRVVFNAPGGPDDIPDSETYEPPKTLDKVFRCVNKYVNFTLDKDKITASQKKGLDMLINYMHTFRFTQQMNSYENQSDRNLCEDAFVRYTYDKPDLTQEEVDQYIELANHIVQGFKVLRRSERMQSALEEITGNDPETMKISMGLVEAIGKASTEYHQCLQRQQKLLDDLKEKRSTRISKELKQNASILNLVQAWRHEEQRIELSRHAEKEQEMIANEVDRLSSLDDIKARILGITKDEIKYG